VADAWDQFPDAPAQAGADPWEQFPDAQRKRVTRAELMAQNPAEYDPKSPQYQEKYGQPGVIRTIAGATLRAPAVFADTAMSLGRGVVAAPVAGAAGVLAAPFVGMDRAANVVNAVQGTIQGQPFTDGASDVLNVAGKPFELLAKGADAAGTYTSNLTGSPLAGTVVNTAIQAAPAVLGRGKVGRGNAGANRPGPPAGARKVEARPAVPPKGKRGGGLDGVPEKAPSLEKLQSDKDAAYKRAEETGVVVSRDALNKLKVQLVNDLKKEGLDKDLHPKTSAALKRVLETKGQLTLSEIETLRKIANDAKGAIDKSDGRLGARIVDKIDDFEDALGEGDVVSGNPAAASAYKEARALNTRLSKAKEIDQLYQRAELNAPNFSGSGMENALRTEFRALAKNERKMRRFTPAERAAIKKVAMGGPVENTLRQLGKLAPTGIVSAGMGTLGGFALGGSAGAALVPAIGTASRYAATRMTRRNANAASELMRRGPGNALLKPRNALATAE
jgi:hypothetical protein